MSFNNDFDAGVISYMIEKGYHMDNNVYVGMIHSHCNTSVFFSGPDDQELRTNAKAYPVYLSVITNNKGEYTAKMAKFFKYEGVITGKKVYQSADKKTITEDYSDKYVDEKVVFEECTVVNPKFSSEFPDFDLLVDKIIEDNRIANQTKMQNNKNQYNSQTFWSFEDYGTSHTKSEVNNLATNSYNDRDEENISDEFADIIFDFLSDLSTSDFGSIEDITNGRSYNKNKYNAKKFLKHAKEYINIEKGEELMILQEALSVISDIKNPFCNKLASDWNNYMFDIIK